MGHRSMDLDYAAELQNVTARMAEELLRVPADVAAQPPAPGKWLIKEIVGHLIDSALNNHQRFVRAQWSSDLVCPPYDQDAWVSTQHYADAPWPDIVVLWRELNRHLARTMAVIPLHERERPRHPHNLHQIAFRAVPADQPVTLEYLMCDYVEHLKHHVDQLAQLTTRTVA